MTPETFRLAGEIMEKISRIDQQLFMMKSPLRRDLGDFPMELLERQRDERRQWYEAERDRLLLELAAL